MSYNTQLLQVLEKNTLEAFMAFVNKHPYLISKYNIFDADNWSWVYAWRTAQSENIFLPYKIRQEARKQLEAMRWKDN